MSGEKTTTQNSQQAQMTPEERQLLQQQIAQNNFMQPYANKNYAALSDNINAILNGKEPAAKGIGGVSDADMTNIVNQSLRDIPTSLQASGVLDSGAAQEYYGRQASNVRSGLAQFNVSSAQNLFNLASGGQSNLQGQYQNNTNTVTGQLAGLRNIITSGSTIGMNPFLKAFQTGLGQVPGNVLSRLGQGTGMMGGGSLGG